MHKRTDDFQKLVYLINLQLGKGAKVTESMLVIDRGTEEQCELDIVIEY